MSCNVIIVEEELGCGIINMQKKQMVQIMTIMVQKGATVVQKMNRMMRKMENPLEKELK